MNLQPQTRRFQQLPFSPDYVYVSMREQTVAGKRLQQGDELPPNLPHRVIRSLYELRRIAPATPVVPQNLKEGDEFYLPGVGTCQLIKAAEATNLAASVTPPQEKAQPQPGLWRAEHRGFGKWYLLDGEAVIEGPFEKEEAKARAEAHNANLHKESPE